MTWEWSHTTEAYMAVRTNIENQPREWLEVVWAEWVALTPDPDDRWHDRMDLRRYAKACVRAKSKAREYLVEFIQRKTEELRLCTNGGWEAHCCPFGCGCHMVPFDVEQTADEEPSEPEEGDYTTEDHQ